MRSAFVFSRRAEYNCSTGAGKNLVSTLLEKLRGKFSKSLHVFPGFDAALTSSRTKTLEMGVAGALFSRPRQNVAAAF